LLARRALNVEVTGQVPDIRPHIAGAQVVVAPLAIGGGTRVKILEAQAMERPVVSTRSGGRTVATGRRHDPHRRRRGVLRGPHCSTARGSDRRCAVARATTPRGAKLRLGSHWYRAGRCKRTPWLVGANPPSYSRRMDERTHGLSAFRTSEPYADKQTGIR
jgi:hypothetical protein